MARDAPGGGGGVVEPAAQGGVLHLPEGFGLDLAHALAGEPAGATDLVERAWRRVLVERAWRRVVAAVAERRRRDGRSTGARSRTLQGGGRTIVMDMPGASVPLQATYDGRLVVLSLLLAALGAYTALTLADPIAVTRGRARALWLGGSATALGLGIWGQHVVGMLAYGLPLPIGYDGGVVAVSFVGTLAAAAAGLFLVRSHQPLGAVPLLGASALVGIAVVSLHYTGMAAVRVAALPMNDPTLLTLAVVVAVALSGVALGLAFHPVADGLPTRLRRPAAALALTGAIGGMHFTALAALRYVGLLSGAPPAVPPAVSATHVALAVAAGLAALTILALLALGAARGRGHATRLAWLEALRRSEERYRAIVQHAPDLVAVVAADGLARYASPSHYRLLGYPAPEVEGTNLFDLMHPEDRASVRAALGAAGLRPDLAPSAVEDAPADAPIDAPADAPADAPTAAFRLRHADGSWRTVDARVTNRLDDPAVRGFVLIGRDITVRAEMEEALQHQALHDALTGLPNRTLLHDRLGHALLAARREGTPLTLLLLDLDRFKEVNDTFGHHVGDALLVEVAARVQGALRASDTVARLGGDEFAALLPGDDAAGAERAASSILAALDAPTAVEGHAVHLAGSIGIALSPTHGADAATLLREADIAMYVAKRTHRGHAVYDATQDRHSPERVARVAALRAAIGRGALVLHYQPKVEPRTGRLAWVEALVRWPHPPPDPPDAPRAATDLPGLPGLPDLPDLLSPEEFIPLAEQTGLIGPLTRWVLDAALRQVGAWGRAGLPLGVEVNLSAWDLYDPGLPAAIAGLLAVHGVAPTRLRLEVTEGTLMADAAHALAVLARIVATGVSIAVDDFGTGYSSLAYLTRLPVDELKIDKSFVQRLAADDKDATIVASTIALGHALGLRVTAEGVEDQATWERLAALGCDLAQGYYVSPPLPPAALARWLEAAPWTVAPASAS